MAAPSHPLHPVKRRRIKRNDPLHENDIEALDAVTVERFVVAGSTGPIERKRLAAIPQTQGSTNNENDQEAGAVLAEGDGIVPEIDYGEFAAESAMPAEKRQASRNVHPL